MAKNKLRHLAEMEAFPNVFQLRKDLRGRWNQDVFKNNNPITLELACGKGEYALALARKYPSRNFIGIDIKGARIWRGAKTALEENITNVVFLRTFIDHLEEYFTAEEVEELWITFPDPHHGSGGHRKRLTAPQFIRHYREVLKPGGCIHLKTDDRLLYEFTLEVIEQQHLRLLHVTDDLYASLPDDEILSVKTYYERQHLDAGKTIKYIRFALSDEHSKQ